MKRTSVMTGATRGLGKYAALAIAVFVEDGSGGASAAGPIVDDYLAAIQNDTHE